MISTPTIKDSINATGVRLRTKFALKYSIVTKIQRCIGESICPAVPSTNPTIAADISPGANATTMGMDTATKPPEVPVRIPATKARIPEIIKGDILELRNIATTPERAPVSSNTC